MSRKYPVKFDCERCGLLTGATPGGRQKPHQCMFQWDGSPAPWPVVPASWIRNRSGADGRLLHGLIGQSDNLRGVRLVREADVGKADAASHDYFNRDDAERLIRQIGTQHRNA